MNKYFMIWLPISLLLRALPIINPTGPVQSFHPTQSPPVTTIPAFPEQSSDASGCPLDLPNDLFTSVKSACTGGKYGSGPLRRLRCCPILASWLYSAYSATALGKQQPQQTSSYYDLPILPNDSETCIDNLENGLKNKGIELMRLNQSCDVVYCECGIRLHPLTCTGAFSVNSVGDLIGNDKVKRLENDCLNNRLHGCSKCLKTLHLLNKVATVNTSKTEKRTSKMQNEDCELMGLTWLLAKNRSAYIHTVSAVLRATMMTTDANSVAQSCTLNSNGMPLAADSSEINDSSSSNIFHSSLTLFLVSLCMFYVSIRQLFDSILGY